MSVPSPHDGESERYERFVQLFVAHESRLRSFLRSLLPDWHHVDEVMQETSLVAWRKFGAFQEGSNFMAWAAAIARFEALQHLRTHSREQRVFSDDVIDLIAQEAVAEADVLERERMALERCLAKLPAANRELLELAHQPGARMHEIAARANKSVEACYKVIQRLRQRLLDCVQRELAQENA